MDIYVIMGIAFAGLLVISIIGKQGSKETFEYDKRFLLTRAESNFYLYLIQIIDKEKHLIFPKVRIADIVKPKKGLSKEQYNKNFWRTSSKHIDFLIVDNKTYLPIVCVELNDKSHNKNQRKKRDILVDNVMRSANIPMVWIPAKHNYDLDNLRTSVFLKENMHNEL